jgi:threonylcarbamoyladenosine tRNA methylthiotransferase MtaB
VASYAIHNFGCRASAADGDAIAAQLDMALARPQQPLQENSGVNFDSTRGVHPDGHHPGVVIVNTCSVTAQAERSARALIRRTHREHPDARILVTGCYAQRDPATLQSLPGVSVVVGNSHKSSVAGLALQSMARPSIEAGFVPLASLLHTPYPLRPFAGEHADASVLPVLPQSARRTRPILKVQDGCGNRCSFCIIPETRGPSRSISLRESVAATEAFVTKGGQELVLSGINLGRWGRDLVDSSSYSHQLVLADLVRALLEETSLPRLRISSVEPMDWTPDLLALFARYATGNAPRLAPHAHLPLQSGADTTLRRMHRRYRPWHYAEKVQHLRSLMPHAAIGADIMVGFPGETDRQFAESLAFVEAQPFTYLHLFRFSPRARTAAEAWHTATPVSPAKVSAGMRALQALADAKHSAFIRSMLGHTLSSVTLRDNTALTANFLSVEIPFNVAPNTLLPLRIASIEGASSGGQRDLRITGIPEVSAQ